MKHIYLLNLNSLSMLLCKQKQHRRAQTTHRVLQQDLNIIQRSNQKLRKNYPHNSGLFLDLVVSHGYINIPTKLITQAGPHLTSQDLGPPTSTRTGTGFELICVLWCSKLRLKFIYQKHLLFKKNPHILDLLLQVLFMRRRRYSGANKNCCHDRG